MLSHMSKNHRADLERRIFDNHEITAVHLNKKAEITQNYLRRASVIATDFRGMLNSIQKQYTEADAGFDKQLTILREEEEAKKKAEEDKKRAEYEKINRAILKKQQRLNWMLKGCPFSFYSKPEVKPREVRSSSTVYSQTSKRPTLKINDGCFGKFESIFLQQE